MSDQRKPVPPEDEIDRTGRIDQVVPGESFEAPPAAREPPTGLDENDAAPGGVDSVDFPGAAAP
ncbi:hypothetical protein ACFOMD_12950 [Sphingoaurantiacus capsulatus]|uniref:Uncharacterized protein n=1 Tax=Sphingoaurantiacus capsulatus TaxID=1771310 RepID=A0ABV7XCD5_9SPHN